MMDAPVRVDSWLWAVRVYKTRSAATTACRAGHIRVNSAKVKAAQTVKPGDEVRIRISGFDRILTVRQTLTKRVGAPVAALAYEDRTPAREPQAALGLRDRGAGRPTKRERRDIDKLRGRD
ncbi:MAG: RNA-binding S4 domain-containing protein [Microbacterium sp.]|uniref:RNA-binding S4 domain-containing protein n=1 Tax=Microbacterium sp. TaxID=51671 RepID=UPI003F9A3074